MRFRIGEKEYSGHSAVEIIHALQLDLAAQNAARVLTMVHGAIERSHTTARTRVSDKLSDEMLALNYLCLRNEYGAGELSGLP